MMTLTRRFARLWHSVPRLYAIAVVVFLACSVVGAALYLLIPQRFQAEHVRSHALLTAGDGTEITIAVPHFWSPYSMSERRLARSVVAAMKAHEDVAPEILKVTLRQRPAAYATVLDAAIAEMPEYAFVFVAEAIGDIAETGYDLVGPADSSRDPLAVMTGVIRNRAVAQLREMLKSDASFMSTRGLTEANLPAYIALLDDTARQTLAAARRGDIRSGHSVDVNFPKPRKTVLSDGGFESDADHDGIADGWHVDPPPPPGMSLGLDAVRLKQGKFSQRLTIAKIGSSSRTLAREVSVTPGARYYFSAWKFVDLPGRYSLRIGESPGDSSLFFTPEADEAGHWTNETGTFVPKGDKIYIYVLATHPGPADHDYSIWLDDVRLESEAAGSQALAETLKEGNWSPNQFVTLTFGAQPVDSQFFVFRKKAWPNRAL